VSLTRDKEHHGLRAHYIVTNTNPFGFLRRCETFQDILFLLVQHYVITWLLDVRI